MSQNNNAPQNNQSGNAQGGGGSPQQGTAQGQGGQGGRQQQGGQQQQGGGHQQQGGRQQQGGGHQQQGGQPNDMWTTRLAGWFSEAILRSTVALIGIALVILATGQLLGLELYGLFADVLTSSVGQWLIVTFIGLLLIGAATKHWGIASSWQ